MNHLQEITEGLMDVFRDLRSGEMEPKAAVEINNTAGKIISAYKTRLAYAIMRGDVPLIEGLETAEVRTAINVANPRSVLKGSVEAQAAIQ